MLLRRVSRPIPAIAAVTAFLLASQAMAHSWYPFWCCDDHDCRELFATKGETVTETKDGYRLWDGRFIGREDSKPSPDRHFHLCEEQTTRAIICFFVPQGES
ncbi:hypothetical protein MHY87_05180 [Microvirga sp. ACRRW]|uniref:hypothetical protein n=1 Tax=Microvirga sp. ACRRW TaxID=2918205 RepID=UPI001EF671AD|nr:hypothetical protein [Microvirga sp. ACRRW]MCG7392292.1 hypothetical protein [Microvirga sp. ACRRW]